MRMRYILRASMAMVALLFLSCVNTEDPTQGATVRLKLTGGIAVNQPADDATRAVSENESLTVNSMRVLIFNNGALVSNNLFESGFSVDGTGDNWIVSMNNDAAYVEARYGANDVYVVLNEAAGGLTASLEAVQTKAAMDNLRTGKVAYTNLIAVDNTNEPGFLMGVYDEVNIDTTKTTLDMTGLGLGTPTYGFPMRRTMAKVVLESVVGGVDLKGKVLGLNEDWNNNAAVDQEEGDTDNDDLIATSAVHILGLDLVNVPTHYSWQQDEYPSTNNYPASPTTYRADPIPVAEFTGQNSSEYFARTWPGSITVSGTVPFTRVDKITDIWKVEGGSGGNAYATIPPASSDQDPAYYYIFTKNQSGYNTSVHNAKLTDLSDDKYDKVKGSGYDHYTVENGNIRLWTKDGTEILDVPNNQVYTLNSGNFITWYKNTYNKDFSTSIPGTPVAGTPQANAVKINPAVWVLDFNKMSYYIPENIPGDGGDYTKLRITASIAIPTAVLDPVKVQEAIKKLAESGETGDLVQDDTIIEWTDANIMKYMYAKGELIPHDQDPNIYALKYAGLSRIFGGTVDVGESTGQYDAITGMTAQKVTIEVPLNNDENATDHNIYRGHEYRVKLYVTKKSSANWTPEAEANRSVTYHELPAMTTRGGESDLCIAAEVIATPVE